MTPDPITPELVTLTEAERARLRRYATERPDATWTADVILELLDSLDALSGRLRAAQADALRQRANPHRG